MTNLNANFDELVVSRLFDFFGTSTPWQRRLWNNGTVQRLREALESSQAVRDGVHSQETLKFLLEDARRASGEDPGLREFANSLQGGLSSDLVYLGGDYRRLEALVPACSENYLSRWGAAIRERRVPNAERAARAIAAHLLDLGYSADYLHRWLWYRRRASQPATLVEVLDDASSTLATLTPRTFNVLVAISSRPRHTPKDDRWLTASAAAAWLSTRGQRGIRQEGGVLLDVTALDPWSAVSLAADQIETIATRVALGGRGDRLHVHKHAWIDGERTAFLLRQSRRLEIGALAREKLMFELRGQPLLDAALHLLAPLDDGAAGSAAAGGWAAIESLLYMPGDKGKVAAGDRVADLVAASWPRAELTTLSYRAGHQVPDEASGANRDRALRMALDIREGKAPTWSESSDAAACERMRVAIAAPSKTIQDVRSYVKSAIRRLYRQRNLVLHGGKLDGLALAPALRASAPLVGAAFDRIAHAWLVEGTHPRELAVRAQLRAERCLTSADLVDLIEPNRRG